MTRSSTPAVTVAICLFNSRRYLEATLHSVFAQTFRDYEIVLVDDGSTDDTPALAEELCRGRHFRLLRQPRRGLSHARRACIEAAAGGLIAFLDHDDLWAPRKLELQVASAREHPGAALFFADCAYVDETGRQVGLVSEHYGLHDFDLSGPRGYLELLRRGCFVWQSTVMARAVHLREVGPFDPAFPYIADYDTWLRMSRRWPLHYTPQVLASWRVHPGQFTNREPEVTLADHRRLLGALMEVASIPSQIRRQIGDRLLGQHRESARRLWRQRRPIAAAWALVRMASYPGRLYAFVRGAVAETRVFGPALRWLHRRLVPHDRHSGPSSTARSSIDAWIDGSALATARTGMFTHTCEWIRALADEPDIVVHVRRPEGAPSLRELFGARADRLIDRTLRTRRSWGHNGVDGRPGAGLARVVRRALGRPRGRPPREGTCEVLIWRGRFHWRRSQRIAVIADLTTALLPEHHTAANVREHTAFIEYVQRHATCILAPSARTKADLLARTWIQPEAIAVVPPLVHPVFLAAAVDSVVPAMHGLVTPYVLFVGAVEPRKNLRRLVVAFERATRARHDRHVLAIVGPDGWDADFTSFLQQAPGGHRVRRTGFLPVEHLPSLYHYADVVVCPSLYEGFGLPVLEAMSSRALVAAASGGAQQETLGDGLLFEPTDVEAMASAIRQAIELPADVAAARRAAAGRRAEQLMARARVALREALVHGS